jgi:hypothetical protein
MLTDITLESEEAAIHRVTEGIRDSSMFHAFCVLSKQKVFRPSLLPGLL